MLVGILCCWMGTFTQLPIVLDGTRHIEELLRNLCCFLGWKSLLLDGYIYTTSNCVRWDSAHRRSSSDITTSMMLDTGRRRVGMAGKLQEFLHENVEKEPWTRVS